MRHGFLPDTINASELVRHRGTHALREPRKVHSKPRSGEDGFTLTEMAIVLVIVALLIGGMLVPFSAQRDLQSANETQKQLAEIKEALLGFAATRGRLPCPAIPTVASGTANAGQEDTPTAAGCTTSVEGVVPWVTLGLPETDAWGRRLTYRVSADFAKLVPVSQNASFTLASNGDISVLATSGGTSLVSNVPAAIISHGKNGLRAYLPDGGQMAATADIDEKENSDSDTDFVSKTQTPSFDDQVAWVVPSILMNRMISAAKLP